MSPLTLPGTIPGLRLHSAPVIYLRTGDRGVAMLTPDGRIVVMFCPAGARGPWTEAASPDELALDLSDPTGRAHAAWWAVAHSDLSTISAHDARVILSAVTGEDMKPEDVDRLRLVCLHVAGVSA
jgi:hypothetical protein